jgi:hypothetical protein
MPFDGLSGPPSDTGGYEWTWIAEPNALEEHIFKRTAVAIVIQLDSPEQALAPIVDRLRSWMPDLPVIGFVQDEGSKVLQETFRGLQIFLAGKLSSPANLISQLERIFVRICNGGMLRGSPGKLLHLIESENRTCTVRLFAPAEQKAGTLFFVEGQLYDARVLNTWGVQSACDILSWDEADIWIENGCRNRQRRIHPGLKSILVESIKTTDPPACAMDVSGQRPTAHTTTNSHHETYHRMITAIEGAAGNDRSRASAFSDPEWGARLRMFASAGTVMGGALRCGTFSLPEGGQVFFVSTPEPVCVRLQAVCRQESILQALLRVGRLQA